MNPDRRYSREHTWVERAPASEGQAAALLVGLTAHAVERLGTLRQLQLSATPGEALAAGESFGSVESNKAVVELYTPVGGRVLAIHEGLAHAPERLHEDCYHDGWLLRLEAGEGEGGEFSQLLDAAAYSELLKTRAADL